MKGKPRVSTIVFALMALVAFVFILSLSYPPMLRAALAEQSGAPKVVEYIIPNYSDITGPYAELTKTILPVYAMTFAWWNENVGKGLGVKLTGKNYDTRYDAAETASIHASITHRQTHSHFNWWWSVP